MAGAKWQKIDIDIPEEFTPKQRKRLADLIIDHIIDRTESGLDKRGKRFPGYSEAYVKSLDFKIAGKSKGSVDLTLSGDMLASLQLLEQKPGRLRIGFEKGSEENARADGNIRGTYGASSPRKGKARDFLGITDRELDKLVDEVA
jgi:hypothetical protein